MRAFSSLYRAWGKRLLDIVVSAMLLPLALPLAALVALVVWLDLGTPVIFRQTRTGKHSRPFVLRKFRTMREASGQGVSDADRLTPLGAFLRRTSLDELPELLHVLSGRMSLVGPRPLLPRYLERYSRRQARRHEVRPGLTGLAQVRGRNLLSWNRRLELDVEYVERLSFALDLSILLRTVWAVVRGHGVRAVGCATMPEFLGPDADDEAGRHGGETGGQPADEE